MPLNNACLPGQEAESSTNQITREGKQITYALSIIQHPKRARACGVGAKSSADRRPVDPPPVVELRVLESEPGEARPQFDITLAYNRKFLMFATLDNACYMGSSQPSVSQLCLGSPVSSVAYLDRPSQAGYFIFPDLSVRHEGQYKLSFHLYEGIADSEHADEHSKMPSPDHITRNGRIYSSPQPFMKFRLQVISLPFTVYNAKKFPGLATSTSLSRTIAAQGCRIRIRRESRMRRPTDKSKESDGHTRKQNANRTLYQSSNRHHTLIRDNTQTTDHPRANTNIDNMDILPTFETGPRTLLPTSSSALQCPFKQQQMSLTPVPHAIAPRYQSNMSFSSTTSCFPTPHEHLAPLPVTAGIGCSQSIQCAQFRHLSATPYSSRAPKLDHDVLRTQTAYSESKTYMYRAKAPYHTTYHTGNSTQHSRMLYMGHFDRTAVPNHADKLSVQPGASENLNLRQSGEVIWPRQESHECLSGNCALRCPDAICTERASAEPISCPTWFGAQSRPNALRNFSAESRQALVAEFGVDVSYKRANGSIVTNATNAEEKQEKQFNHQRDSPDI